MNIITTLQALLNDSGVFWPVQNLLDAINEAQLIIFAKTKWARISQPLLLQPNDDLVTIPTTILIPQWIEDGKDRYFASTHRELEHWLRTWRNQPPAKPQYFILWDAFHFRVSPRPDATYAYTLWGIGYPTEITVVSPNILGPNNYTQAVVNYAAGLLLEFTRPDLADIYMAQATQQISDFKRHLRNYQSHNIRRFRPGTRFDLQQSGDIRQLPTYYPVEN